MAEVGFKGLIIAFLIVGLFFFAMVNFAYEFAIDNGANQTILGNSAINQTFGNLQSQLNTSSGTAQTQREAFESDTASFSTGFFLLSSILGAGKVFTSSVVGIYNILIGTVASTLGIPPIVLGVATAVLLITIIFLAWRAYKLGE